MTKIKKKKNKIQIHNKNKKIYSINEALKILKKNAVCKFIESVDIAINLGINPKKTEQNIKNSVILPYGTGNKKKVVVFAENEEAIKAKKAGADEVGMEELYKKIKNYKIKFDAVIASPNAMKLVKKLGPILGPKGLMPNTKLGTITTDIENEIKNIKKGKINYKNEKNGIIHATIGKISFKEEELKQNIKILINSIKKNKPITAKGLYIKKITLSTTMGLLSTTINNENI